MSKGKKLTREQRHVLERNGIKDTSDWLYVKEETTSDEGKSLSKYSAKTRRLVIRNINTGEERRVDV